MPYISNEEKICYALALEPVLQEMGMDNYTHTFGRDLYCYINYDRQNSGMEHPREFYSRRILKAIEMIFDGKTRKFIDIVCDRFCFNLFSDTIEEDIYTYIRTGNNGERILSAFYSQYFYFNEDELEDEATELLREVNQL